MYETDWNKITFRNYQYQHAYELFGETLGYVPEQLTKLLHLMKSALYYQEKLVKAQNQAIEQHPTQNLKHWLWLEIRKYHGFPHYTFAFDVDTSLALGNSIDRT